MGYHERRSDRVAMDGQDLTQPGITFETDDCRALPFADQTCDLYVSSYLFDMLPDAELAPALREMQRVLNPGGRAILLTMTLVVQGAHWASRAFYHLANGFYNLGYHKGLRNSVWRFLFAGYAPHCRPIDLARSLRALEGITVEQTRLCRVTAFPVRLLYLRKRDD